MTFLPSKAPMPGFGQADLHAKKCLREWRTIDLGVTGLSAPLGVANHAVNVGEFIGEPTIFSRLKQDELAIAASIESPRLLRTGANLLRLFFLCLGTGGAIVQVFFPQMVGAGLTPTTLMILISIWSMGVVGLLALILGGIQYKYRVYVACRCIQSDLRHRAGL